MVMSLYIYVLSFFLFLLLLNVLIIIILNLSIIAPIIKPDKSIKAFFKISIYPQLIDVLFNYYIHNCITGKECTLSGARRSPKEIIIVMEGELSKYKIIYFFLVFIYNNSGDKNTVRLVVRAQGKVLSVTCPPGVVRSLIVVKQEE